MNDLPSFPDLTVLLGGALIFLRIGGILFALPIFGDQPTPVRARVFIALAMTLGLYATVPEAWFPNLDADPIIIASYIVRELSIGLVIGFVSRIAFDGLLMAASIVSYQMGFGTGQLFMPDFGGQMDSFTAFHRIFSYFVVL